MAASCAWRVGRGYWWLCSPFTSDLDTKREDLLAKRVSPDRKVRCGGRCGARSSCPVPWHWWVAGQHACYTCMAESEEENMRMAKLLARQTGLKWSLRPRGSRATPSRSSNSQKITSLLVET